MVRELVVRGADTMVSYGVDGVITTPMQSALSKGDVAMTLALLTSRSTKVRLADLDAAPKIKRDLISNVLVQRISGALEDGARELLIRRDPPPTTRRPLTKLSISDSVSQYLRSTVVDDSSDPPSPMPTLLHASPNDQVRCPPKEMLEPVPSDAEDSALEEDEDDSTTHADEEISSMASTADDDSLAEEL